MNRPLLVARPLPLQVPTAFVRIRPRGLRICGEVKTEPAPRCSPAHPKRRC